MKRTDCSHFIILKEEILLLSLILLFIPFTRTLAVDLTTQGLIQGSIIESSKNQPWTPNWLEEGTGISRFDDDKEDVQLTQGILASQLDLTSNITLNYTISYYPDDEQRWGITESYIVSDQSLTVF